MCPDSKLEPRRTVQVAIVTDRTYLPWCATSIVSCARATLTYDLRVHVLHAPDVSKSDQRRLAQAADDHGAAVEFHPVDDAAVSMLPTKGPELGGRVSWVRLLLPDALPEVERVIYLDADTLVVGSIAPLWELALGDAPLAAVANVTHRDMRPHLASLGVDDAARYFNAGVLVVNLDQWRREQATDNLVRFVTSREGLSWFDQDGLNAVFAGRWKPLHPRWNAMNSLWTWPDLAADIFGKVALHEATSDPGILHFEGPSLSKPWHYLCPHPWRSEYRSTLARTPWAGTPLEDRTLATMLIARLPHDRQLAAYVGLNHARQRLSGVRSRVATRLRHL